MTDLNVQSLFRWRVPRRGPLQIGGRSYEPQVLVEKLSPLITAARRQRIDQVLTHRTWSVGTICDGLYDVGNISAVMRSAESFGFVPFKILERAEAKYKMSDRISRGSEKWLDIEKTGDSISLVKELKSSGYRILSTSLGQSRPLAEVDLSQPLCIVFGNEKDGVRSEMLDLSDEIVHLPMLGFAESFNISVAAALCYQSIYQKRLAAHGQSGDLSEEEAALMRATYILRSLGPDQERLGAILQGVPCL